MIWLGRKEVLAKRAKRAPVFIEIWGLFPENWHVPEISWEPYRMYLKFIGLISIPRRWIPHRSDGYGLCTYCGRVVWIEDRLINHRCNQCRQLVRIIEDSIKTSTDIHAQKIWDTFKWTNLNSLHMSRN